MSAEIQPSKAVPFDWASLSLFFLLSTAFWIPPLPASPWSLAMVLRICWLSTLLATSYIVLFRNRPSRTRTP